MKANENTNGEHFSDLNSTNKANAFIREVFQNSIDGAADQASPVKIRVFFSGSSQAAPYATWSKYFGSLIDHVKASLNDLPMSADELEALRRGKCRYVIVEDFGTSGLTGAVDAWDLASGATDENHFYHFFRTVGRSGKTSGKLGSWGIGKFVFLMASQIRAMIGFTVPNSGPSEGKQLLMGQTTLRYHVLNGVSLVNDGWFAEERNSDNLALPIESQSLIEEFRQDWGVARSIEPGFSVLIPFADELDPYEILKTVVDEYCGKILDGSLEVSLEDADYGEDELLTAATLRPFVERYRDDPDRPEWSDILRKVDALAWYLTLEGECDFQLDNSGLSFKRGEWELEKVDDALKSDVRDRLESNGRVCIRVPVMIHPTKLGKDCPARFDIVIGKIDGPRKAVPPEFFRKWLRIGGRKQSGVNGYETYVLVGEGVLNELLRDAEGPAHTEWSDKRDRFKGRYKHGSAWLKFVKSAPSQVTNCLLGTGNERDSTALVDLFPKGQRAEGAAGGSGKAGKNKSGKTPGKPEVPEGTDPEIDLMPAEDGFVVAVERSGTVRLEMAFDVSRGNPFAKWHKVDFEADQLSLNVSDGDAHIINRSNNQLVVKVTKDQLTRFAVTGFNDDRDLRVRAAWVGGQG